MKRIISKKLQIKSKTKYIFFIFIVVFFCFYFIENHENVDNAMNKYTLNNDGICILFNREYAKKTIDYPSDDLKKDILEKLPNGYVFINYVYKIENSTLSTFHRDVTSSKHIYKTTYPVYTAILYKYSGELLSFCPGSNLTYPFVWSRIQNVSGESGSVFLFDSDILHAGCDNECNISRDVLQYKICHKDDLEKLHSLSGIHIIKTETLCNPSIWNNILRKTSYYFEMPINTFLYPLMIKRENTNSMIGRIQEWIPISFYNN
jgi:hypothetical protein